VASGNNERKKTINHSSVGICRGKNGKKTINQEAIKAPETGVTPDEVASLWRKWHCSG